MTAWIILTLRHVGDPVWVLGSSIVRMTRSGLNSSTEIVQAGMPRPEAAVLIVQESPEQITRLINDAENSR